MKLRTVGERSTQVAVCEQPIHPLDNARAAERRRAAILSANYPWKQEWAAIYKILRIETSWKIATAMLLHPLILWTPLNGQSELFFYWD